jgi:hypothetical protein
VKVVDDIANVDMDAVRYEVMNHETLIFPEAHFQQGAGSGCACCR